MNCLSGNTLSVPKNWIFIIELPPRRDEVTVVEKIWAADLSDGLYFGSQKGQKFFFPEGLAVHAEVQWMEESLLSARIAVKSTVRGECARCLANTELAISDELMYLYHLRGLEFGKDTKLQSDDGFMPVEVDYWGRTLSLLDQVWETLLAALPVKFLCREDCAGLCPNCGSDLNDGACSRKTQETDSRFEALKGIAFAEEPEK